MMDLVDIARVAHTVDIALDLARGTHRLPWDDLPLCERLAKAQAVRLLLDNPDLPPRADEPQRTKDLAFRAVVAALRAPLRPLTLNA
jgi:hypothetical protein